MPCLASHRATKSSRAFRALSRAGSVRPSRSLILNYGRSALCWRAIPTSCAVGPQQNDQPSKSTSPTGRQGMTPSCGLSWSIKPVATSQQSACATAPGATGGGHCTEPGLYASWPRPLSPISAGNLSMSFSWGTTSFVAFPWTRWQSKCPEVGGAKRSRPPGIILQSF